MVREVDEGGIVNKKQESEQREIEYLNLNDEKVNSDLKMHSPKPLPNASVLQRWESNFVQMIALEIKPKEVMGFLCKEICAQN